ncbi:MAG: ferritin-like domain-containing protein [Acidimicrobiaceae bacterium]|nr:ferritin-like domain-containing protein [Acidimicrobiaceae bacterium]
MTYMEPRDFPSQVGVPGVPWWSEDLRQPSFMRDFPPSVWEDLALAHIEQHIATETGAAEAYEDLGKAEDPQVRYLASLIAADEMRHHQLLQDIAQSLRSRVSETVDQSAIAKVAPLSSERRGVLLEKTRQLLEIEENDTGELKKLRRELDKAPDETVWPLLVEIMESDTEKHIRILKAIERYLTRERW